MVTLGITGHQSLEPRTERAVTAMIIERLRDTRDVVGISSLAAGADQLFARCVLDAGGMLVVVVPSAMYETTFASDVVRDEFLRLLTAATDVIRLQFAEPTEEAFYAAGKEIVDRCEILIAVWDSQPAGGLGGTGDVVKYAEEQGKAVVVLWPPGGKRS